MAAASLGLKASRPGLLAGALGLGSVILGAWGALAPASLGRVLKVEVETARLIGFRDLGTGVLLLVDGGRWPLVARAIFDLGDSISFRHTRPWIARGAAVIGLTALREAATAPPGD